MFKITEKYKYINYSFKKLFLIFLFLFSATQSFAAPATVTFQARIVKPDLTNLESSSVSFKFYYLYPKPAGTDLQCVIYTEEITGVDMTGSKGLVTLQLGSGTRTYGSGDLKNVFDNSTASYTCQAGGTYIPAATDNRRIIVQFNDGTGVQTLPPSDLSAVPYAMQSYNTQRLGNSLAIDFLKFTDFTGTCGTGEYLKYDSTASPKFSCAIPTGTGAGIVMSVAAGTGPLLVGGTAADPTISIPQASAIADGYLSSADFTTFNSKLSSFTSLTSSDITGKLGYTPAANSDARLSDTRTPTDGSVTAVKIASSTITFDKFNQTAATTGQVIKWNGSAWVASADNTVVGSVASVAGRTGAVTLSSSDISGLAFGTTAGTYAQGNDSRFSDERNPINDSVTSAKILDGTIASADISAGAITFDKLTQASATSGQVIKWNGSAWIASSDNTGAGGTVTSVSASGPLSSSGSSTPNITIAKADGTTDGYLSSADFTIFAAKLSDFSTLVSSDITGKLGYTPVNPATAVTSVAGRTGVVTLSSSDITGLAFGSAAGTYAQGNDSRFMDERTPINDSVTSAKILDATITSADISTGAITFDKFNQSAASTGQVIKWDGSAWVASSDSTNSGNALTSNPLSQFAATTSVQLLGVLSDETGTGAAVFSESPTFTGAPLAPTAAINTNTTQVATTAFVLAQAASSNPLMDGVAAIGVGTTFARNDHVHASDTSRAPAAGSASITTLGTITTGLWNGTAIPVLYGGTGATTAAGARSNLGLTIGSSVGNIPQLGATGISGSNMCTGDGSGAIICTTAVPTSSQWSAVTGGINFAGGNVGIGTTAPQAGLVIATPSGAGTQNGYGLGYYGAIVRGSTTTTGNMVGVALHPGTDTDTSTSAYTAITAKRVDNSNSELGFATMNTGTTAQRVVISNVGNVGIGATNPGAKLEVNGQVKITGGTPGAGKVLTSDAAGLATWQSSSGSVIRINLRFTRTLVCLGASCSYSVQTLAAKDAACVTDFGSNYQTASGGDLNAYWTSGLLTTGIYSYGFHISDGNTAYPYQFAGSPASLQAQTTNYYGTNPALTAPVACIRKDP